MVRQVKEKFEWGDLETFEALGFKLGRPEITISASAKTFTMSSGFVHRAKKQIANNTHVVLSFSKQNEAIVFEFIDRPDAPGAIKMTKGANISISGTSFFNYNSLNPSDIKGKYSPELHNIPKKGNCWIIFLRKKKSVQ
jgi:hypothetical protein